MREMPGQPSPGKILTVAIILMGGQSIVTKVSITISLVCVGETHEEDQDTLITQLCNWTELDDKGIPPDVAQAAILFSPNDLGKVRFYSRFLMCLPVCFHPTVLPLRSGIPHF